MVERCAGVATVLTGVVWGRETVWVNAQGEFAALVSRIHILPFEAVRENLATALPALQAVASARVRNSATDSCYAGGDDNDHPDDGGTPFRAGGSAIARPAFHDLAVHPATGAAHSR